MLSVMFAYIWHWLTLCDFITNSVVVAGIAILQSTVISILNKAYACGPIVGETGHAFCNCDLHGV